MILGIGTDIIEIDRIRQAYLRFDDAFLNKILSVAEITYCLSKDDPVPSLAARFCGKEAVAKALGTGIGENIRFSQIEILPDANGKPIVTLLDCKLESLHNTQFMISLSHSKTVAMATAIWIQKSEKGSR